MDNAFSAANLVKQSAKQIRFLRDRKKYFESLNIDKDVNPPTKRMVECAEKQLVKSSSEFLEMRGTFEDDYLVFFCWDEIVVRGDEFLFVERKEVEGDAEDWYFQSSLIQSAFYADMSQYVDDYYTAKFFTKAGNEKKYLSTKKGKKKFRLVFGDKTYKVKLKGKGNFVDFYMKKARASFDRYSATLFDDKHKHKEWKHLKKYLKYEEV